MSLKLIITLLFSINIAHPQVQSPREDLYDPPRSIEYPFGDETYNDYDFREWRHLMRPSDYIIPWKTEEVSSKCHEHKVEEEREFVEKPYQGVNECSKCDVRPLNDNRAVVMECFHCSDVTLRSRRRGRHPERLEYVNLTYLVRYVELHDYTLPNDTRHRHESEDFENKTGKE